MTRERWPVTNIAWIDVETDGVDAHRGHLLEIACLVTDSELNVLDEKGFHAVVAYSTVEMLAMRDEADPFVREMHDKTGLWLETTSVGASPLSFIDSRLRDYLMRYGKPREMPVGGNSVRLDMNFIDAHLPLTAQHLSYHMRDVSTIAGFVNDWYEDVPPFEKHNDHTAMRDIRESIREMKHYRDTVFRPVSETTTTSNTNTNKKESTS